MTNLFTDTRYVEGINRLAIGVEPRDAHTGRATVSPVDVRHEVIPHPFERWRRWGEGESLTQALPRFRRQRSGRFALLYGFDGDDRAGGVFVTCRLDNVRAVRCSGHRRRFVPRRIRLEAIRRTEIEEAIDPAIGVARRGVAVTLFPGSAAPIDPRATVIRGQVWGPPEPDGESRPVRWCRVQALEEENNTEVGWTHGDDRGEFALALGQVQNGERHAAWDVRLLIGVPVPPPDPNDVGELQRSVDHLWDLPVEEFGAGPWPANDPTASGRSFLPEHQIVDAGARRIPLGRTTSIEINVN